MFKILGVTMGNPCHSLKFVSSLNFWSSAWISSRFSLNSGVSSLDLLCKHLILSYPVISCHNKHCTDISFTICLPIAVATLSGPFSWTQRISLSASSHFVWGTANLHGNAGRPPAPVIRSWWTVVNWRSEEIKSEVTKLDECVGVTANSPKVASTISRNTKELTLVNLL